MIKLVKKTNHVIDYFFIFGLFVFFCSVSCLLIVMGVRQYHNITNQMLKTQDIRTAAAYLRENFQCYDTAGSISFTEFDKIPVISFRDNEQTELYIYVFDDYLREFSFENSTEFSPALGTPIVKMQNLTLEAHSSHLYCFTLTDIFDNVCPIYISWNAK